MDLRQQQDEWDNPPLQESPSILHQLYLNGTDVKELLYRIFENISYLCNVSSFRLFTLSIVCSCGCIWGRRKINAWNGGKCQKLDPTSTKGSLAWIWKGLFRTQNCQENCLWWNWNLYGWRDRSCRLKCCCCAYLWSGKDIEQQNSPLDSRRSLILRFTSLSRKAVCIFLSNWSILNVLWGNLPSLYLRQTKEVHFNCRKG